MYSAHRLLFTFTFFHVFPEYKLLAEASLATLVCHPEEQPLRAGFTEAPLAPPSPLFLFVYWRYGVLGQFTVIFI